MRRVGHILGAVVLGVAMMLSTGAPAGAWATPPCDFMTGGGFIITTASGMHPPAKANFGVGGGCKLSGPNAPFWGHLEYIDHGTGLNTHWMSITAYRFVDAGTGTDPKTHQPTGTRIICGTARTNQFGNVNWVVGAKDAGEPGTNDEFAIRLTIPVGPAQHIVYTTEGDSSHLLAGGNIQLHKPNPSTAGSFSTPGDGRCPAFDGPFV
jgi:hypothetical protein